MARFCEKHMKRAIETLFSRVTGIEYDLCSVCLTELDEILNGKPETEVANGRKRTPGRPKTAKN